MVARKENFFKGLIFFIPYNGTLYFVTFGLSNPHTQHVTKLYFSQYKPQYLREAGLLECDTEVLTKVLSTTQTFCITMPCLLVNNYRFLRKGQAVQQEYSTKTLLDLLDPGHEGTSLRRNVGNIQGILNLQDY